MIRQHQATQVVVLNVTWKERLRCLWHGTIAIACTVTCTKFPGIVTMKTGVIDRGQGQSPEAK